MTATISDYERISSDDGSHSVVVPEHTDETRYRAAKVVADAHFEPWDERTEGAALDMLAARAIAVSFTQHTTFPDDGCDGLGWWCESPGNGGETRDFWSFDWDDIEDARETAEAMPDDAEVTE